MTATFIITIEIPKCEHDRTTTTGSPVSCRFCRDDDKELALWMRWAIQQSNVRTIAASRVYGVQPEPL